jgi:hypothetical protein
VLCADGIMLETRRDVPRTYGDQLSPVSSREDGIQYALHQQGHEQGIPILEFARYATIEGFIAAAAIHHTLS